MNKQESRPRRHWNVVAGLAGGLAVIGLLSLLEGPGGSQSAQTPMATPFRGTLVLGCPTATSVAASVLSEEGGGTASIALGTSQTHIDQIGTEGMLVAGDASTLTVDGLAADTAYCGRLTLECPGQPPATKDFAFHTARAAGSTFTFCIQADSHPERLGKQFDPLLYAKTLASMAASRPDFLFALGDDFSVDQLKAVNPSTVRKLYVTQRDWLSSVGAPVFLVNGNHEQAALANYDGTASNVAVWAQTARNALFPQPAPDVFYSGDPFPVEWIGLLRHYYAFTWGDALFVVIDPYWHSPEAVDNIFGASRDAKRERDVWDVTLGDAQHQWLKTMLETSDAKYKFVFAHHVNGTGRGGVEQAGVGEWGDTAGLVAHRPGWTETTHELFVRNGVTAFFQGHDHLFAHQELDGVVYQTLPEPANPAYTVENADAYRSGVLLPNSGHLRVRVSPERATIEYVRSFLDRPGEVAYAYEVLPREASHDASSPDAQAPSSIADTALTDPGVSVILGRPTANSVAMSLLADRDRDVVVEYAAGGSLPVATPLVALRAGEPQTVELTGLRADSEVSYRVVAGGATSVEHTFRTQRASGSTFTFTMDADPHEYDPRFSPAVFAKTLSNAATDRPDFHIDLGDTFMTEKIRATTYEDAEALFSGMRSYFGLIAADAALFLVNGNHDGELGWLLEGVAQRELPVWSASLRQAYYPGPRPGEFYSGATSVDPRLGGPRDGYYAWTWGDALFVVLDPFWYTTQKPVAGGRDENWTWTLGREQFDWLHQTLATSAARFKFVFVHHLVGGSSEGRGGVEAAGFYEWGGQNADGTYGFDAHRSGWGQPIHELLVEHGVTAVFHGHDHVFVKQEKDGVVYQEVPQPSVAGPENISMAGDYGYVEGEALPSSGHLRVTVAPGGVTVDYVRAVLPQDEAEGRADGETAFSYLIP